MLQQPGFVWRLGKGAAATIAVLLAVGCGATKQVGRDVHDADSEGDVEEGIDQDGDGISDEDEGRYATGGPVDTDDDGVPDYLDKDSDGDGIFDEVERGITAPLTFVADSDSDQIPDFRDLDSDNNGIEDSREGAGDFDEDGTRDFADLDNDGDTITDVDELAGSPNNPPNFDGDALPDYLDNDSDDDLIADIQEARGDADGDGTLDRFELDSDGDTVSDSYEARDANYSTWPPDHDGDRYYSFRDPDSDNDGLGDGWEVQNDMDPYSSDTDNDTFEDLIELAADSDPRDSRSTPNSVGNFFFVVPFNMVPNPAEGNIVFTTSIRRADIFLLIDTTGSMGGEIDNLKQDLRTVVIPRISLLLEDVYYGVGGFDDYPISPYGGAPPAYNDRVFYLLQRVTNVSADVQSAVDQLRVNWGSDCPESQVPALYATATGSGYGPYLSPQLGCDFRSGEFGYPCFRAGAVPIVVMITDAPFHNGPGHYDSYSGVTPRPPEYDDAIGALRNRRIKVMTIVSSGGCDTEMATAHARRLAQDTGAVDANGNPLVFSVSGSGRGLSNQVVSAIQALSGNVPVSLGVTARDDPADELDALRFIRRLAPSTVGGTEDPRNPGTFCEGGLTVRDTNADTMPDIFDRVIPGTTICFRMQINTNNFVEPTEEPQIFRTYLDLIADEITTVDVRTVIFFVPPKVREPFGPPV